MRYLVIAEDYECRKYEILMGGTDKEISEFTIKKEDSLEIRKEFKNQVLKFNNKYNDNGDIVIIDDELENKRIKVLYKKDIAVFKNIILNQKFIISTFKSKLCKIYTEADFVDIRTFKGTSYEKYIKQSFKNKKTLPNYYDIVRKIISLYKEYIKDKIYLDTPNEIYIKYLKNKQQKLKDSKKNIKSVYNSKNDNIDGDFYLDVLDIYQKGGIEELLLYYTIDDLYSKLSNEELKSIELGKTK